MRPNYEKIKSIVREINTVSALTKNLADKLFLNDKYRYNIIDIAQSEINIAASWLASITDNDMQEMQLVNTEILDSIKPKNEMHDIEKVGHEFNDILVLHNKLKRIIALLNDTAITQFEYDSMRLNISINVSDKLKLISKDILKVTVDIPKAEKKK